MHIFSLSINKDHRKGNKKVSQAIFFMTGLTTVYLQQMYAVTVWMIMQCFGGVKVKDELNGN